MAKRKKGKKWKKCRQIACVPVDVRSIWPGYLAGMGDERHPLVELAGEQLDAIIRPGVPTPPPPPAQIIAKLTWSDVRRIAAEVERLDKDQRHPGMGTASVHQTHGGYALIHYDDVKAGVDIYDRDPWKVES